MCYLIAKKINNGTYVVLKTTQNKYNSEFIRSIIECVDSKKIQIEILNRPLKQKERDKGLWVRSEEEFLYAIKNI